MKRIITWETNDGCICEGAVSDRSPEYARYAPEHAAYLRLIDAKRQAAWNQAFPGLAICAILIGTGGLLFVPSWFWASFNVCSGIPMLAIGLLAGWAVAFRTRLPKRAVPRAYQLPASDVGKVKLTNEERFGRTHKAGLPDCAERPGSLLLAGHPCKTCGGSGVEQRRRREHENH